MNKYLTEEQNNLLKLAQEIEQIANGRQITIMEVCGTHTMRIAEFGLRQLLPQNIRLISGPGCPVCVTDEETLSQAMAIAAAPNVIFASFGDMLRVPAGPSSLLQVRDKGADIRMVLSPLDALRLAEENPAKQVVFFAVGFETTAPLTAATILCAKEAKVSNFFIFPSHKTMPAALRCLLTESNAIDALLCPGHVAVIGGSSEFNFVAEDLHKPAAIAGFKAGEIMLAIKQLVQQCSEGRAELCNCYPQAVTKHGNLYAQAAMQQVFSPCDANWRGLGSIAGSGLQLAPNYVQFDAREQFAATLAQTELLYDNPKCCCGQILRGEMMPAECPLFGDACTPNQPCGACMVSEEGACAAAYKYRKALQ